MISCALAVINPGDEVVVLEPFYENYGPDVILCGAQPKFVALREPDWSIDERELRQAISDRTKAVILNTPNNPTGKVFSAEELELIASLCLKYDALVLSDEIYEHITFDGTGHVPIASLPGMRERTITINSLSKTYSVTGWRIGWALGPRHLIDGVRKVHDFVTVGAPAPLQAAGVTALQMPQSYYVKLASDYQVRRDLLIRYLEEAGFHCSMPKGAYYVMTDISGFGCPSDVEFAHRLIANVGVGGVPGSSFYHLPELGRQKFRFVFAKRLETLEAAGRQLLKTKDLL
jgi:aminotransferase